MRRVTGLSVAVAGPALLAACLAMILWDAGVCLAQEGAPTPKAGPAAGNQPAQGPEYFVSPEGKKENNGTKESPWDIASALAGEHKMEPGGTLWIRGGRYKYPDRRVASKGFQVKLAGTEAQPIHVRALRAGGGQAAERVTIDGGLYIVPPCSYVWVWDLEILVSEPNRQTKMAGSSPGEDLARPWGGLEILAGAGCKYINLIIHDNGQGVGFWTGAQDSEVYGCLIYDNGWRAPDRGHGHAIYSQNQVGTKTISDCIMTGGYSYTLHAYGSEKAYVDNYLIEGNIVYDGGPFLVGGGRPSHNIRILRNYLHNVSMQVGYSAPENEDCEIRDNVIVNGSLTINKYKKVAEEGNTLLRPNAPRAAEGALTFLRPNKYDPDRANLVIFNWGKADKLQVDAAGFLKNGEAYRLKDPQNFFGEPMAQGECKEGKIEVPTRGEFGAFVVLKGK